MNRILIFCPGSTKTNPHLDFAISIREFYGINNSCIVYTLIEAIKLIRNYDCLYFQKTSLKNLFLAWVARAYGLKCILYVHEPLTIKNRIKKGVPVFKSFLVSIFHSIEILPMNMLLTGNKANRSYLFRRLKYAPLLLNSFCNNSFWDNRSGKVLYFGRLDTEKYFNELYSTTNNLDVYATSNLNVKIPIPIVGPFASVEKNNIFQRYKYVWCVQRNSYSQSGVVVDALRNGCVVMLSYDDPLIKILNPSEYIPIGIPFDRDSIGSSILSHNRLYLKGPITPGSYNDNFGEGAFDLYWRPVLNEKPN